MMIILRPAGRACAAVMLAVLALLVASCSGESGMYQGGGDDSPRWVRNVTAK